MKKEDRDLLNRRAREISHSLIDHKFSDKESRLIENAFLLSSVIELLTTRPKDEYRLKPKETKMFIDLATYLEKIESADAYMSNQENQLSLHPEDVELLTTVATLGEKSLGKSVPKVLKTVKKIIADAAIPPKTKGRQTTAELTSVLRTLFNGIKVTISQNDDQYENLNAL